MGFLQIILIAIFFYLIYKIFIQRYFQKPDKKDLFEEESGEQKNIQKHIDMSDVEDADYKEIE
jgi:hypothetical protein